ncbi:hypothetical protein TBLA_0B01220 [Henningerozyma blattae CBS 6284]|uniref:H/ACA ribonucleoprotein complex non-core subunit NAF1 n=1 Tax=Henningerozyma blattae (strain ATCC 34711 / CBS 6284 / DSM 70876 / NBRC 10599 / NRRL Y-10934 / UCD 77-7) TaxID=1071380 RepID=I2GXW3_HENB6|nr:hypothetical protein TBLA_0B01220 [Tetrapisispora blattae CBS 6284]CCH58965.1 hypothetical protein TBLA_0B01220 [Tetrapisispora blattae CBS 6284]
MSDDLFSKALANPEATVEVNLPEVALKGNESASESESESEGENKSASESESEGENKSASESESEGENKSESKNKNKSNSASASDSDSSSDSSSDNEEEEEEGSSVEEGVVDEEEEGSSAPIRSAHEIVEEVVEIPNDYKIDKKTNIQYIGTIHSIFEKSMIIHANGSGEQRVLKDGSIFCFEDHRAIGRLMEVFGPLQSPYYRVGMSSGVEEESKDLVGEKAFIVMPDSRWVDTFELKKVKGSDASNGFDEEVAPEEQEFSDDEEERKFKSSKKNKKNKRKNDGDGGSGGGKMKMNKVYNAQPMKIPKGMMETNVNANIGYRSRNHRGTTSGSNMPVSMPIPQGVPQGMPQGLPPPMPQSVPHGVPQGIPNMNMPIQYGNMPMQYGNMPYNNMPYPNMPYPNMPYGNMPPPNMPQNMPLPNIPQNMPPPNMPQNMPYMNMPQHMPPQNMPYMNNNTQSIPPPMPPPPNYQQPNMDQVYQLHNILLKQAQKKPDVKEQDDVEY